MIKKIKEITLKKYISVSNGINNFLYEEKGSSELTTTIIIIGIVIIVAALFKTQLLEMVESVFSNMQGLITKK